MKTKNKNTFPNFFTAILLLFFLCSFHNLIAQSIPSSRKTITAEFAFQELEFAEITVTTNVLKVRNNNGKNYTFTLSINLPSGWKTLNNQDKEYLLRPNDSVYIPVRIITSNKKSKGGTKYSISAYINTNEGKQMAYARFIVGRPKITNWQMQVLPRPRIYFLNGESNSSFKINVSNQGDETQEVLVSMQKIGEGLQLMDTTNKIIKKNYFELNLPPYKDTTLSYNVLVSESMRNQSRIDVWSYRPNFIAIEKRYSLFIRASEVRLETGSALKKTKKVDFVRLANSIDFVKLNNSTLAGNGSNTIPLTIFTSVNNLFGQQPIANTIFQGSSNIGKYNTINYQFQTSLTYYKFSKDFYTSRFAGNINYNMRRSFIGYVLSGNAKTLMFGYNLNRFGTISSFIARQRFFGSSFFNTFGLNYGGKVSNFFNFNFGSQVSLFKSNPRISHWHNLNLNFNLKLITLGLFGSYQYSPIGLAQDRLLNVGYGFSFSTSLIKFYNFSFGYFHTQNNQTTNNVVSNSNRFNNFFMNNNIKLWRGRFLNINTNYIITNSTTLLPNDSTASFNFNNLISLTNPTRKSKNHVSIIPFYFFDIVGFQTNRLMNYGVQLNIANNKFKKDYYIGGSVRFGYSNLMNIKGYGAVFNSQANLFIRYKVWNLLGLYNYGPFSNIEKVNVLTTSPATVNQMIRISIGHQYQFKNKHFVWENNPTYIYLNKLKRNTVSLFSQLYYYTDNRLRVCFFMNYNISSGLGYSYNVVTTGTPVLNTESQKKKITYGSLFGLNIKKDFSIPIPKRFRNNKFCDSKFVVFLDVNGNNKMEEGEVPVENVVLRMNDYEVITNEKGSASFINISFAKYKLQVFPLVDVGSWFPNVPDSMEVCGPEPIYIPFTKGVQVYGLVELDREEYAGQLFEKLDVSRFKIYLVDSTGKTHTSVTDNRGNFNFYVPYGKYTLKFDENALGTSFYLPENDIPLDLSTGIESYYHHFLIIEKRRKVRKKIFGPDGKITYIEEEASGKGKKDKKEGDSDENLLSKADSLNNANTNVDNGKDGKDGSFNYQIKETKLDSLIKLLNELLKKVATKPDVRAIVKQEIQLLRDELNATFTIQIEEFPKGKRPTGVLLQLIRMKKVEELKQPDGKIVYYSGDYKTVQDAEKFCKDFQASGFRNAKVANRKTLLSNKK